jgi:hypothetical protein
MGIRFRFFDRQSKQHKVAFLKRDKAKGSLSLGSVFWSETLGRVLKSNLTFRVVAVGREGFVPTVDVRPLAFA